MSVKLSVVINKTPCSGLFFVCLVPLCPISIRNGPEAPEHSLHRALLPGVYSQDPGLWLPGELLNLLLVCSSAQWCCTVWYCTVNLTMKELQYSLPSSFFSLGNLVFLEEACQSALHCYSRFTEHLRPCLHLYINATHIQFLENIVRVGFGNCGLNTRHRI